MSQAFSKADANAYACSYVLLNLLQRMEQKEPGLIDELLAGARGDFEASKAKADLPPAVPAVFEETIALLERASSYKLNAKPRRGAE